MDTPLFLACSPRAGGNCDSALAIVRESLPDCRFQFAHLRDHPVMPCTSCGNCSRRKLSCPLASKDASAGLFDALQTASVLVLASPIYFYHVPAQLKALMDRSQPWWMLRDVWKEIPARRRVAHVILMGARPRGARLFEGSLLSLRCWLGLFGFTLAEPLTLYGLEGPDALRENPAHHNAVTRYAGSIRASLDAANSGG